MHFLIPAVVGVCTLFQADNWDQDVVRSVIMQEVSLYERPITVLDFGFRDGDLSFQMAKDFPESVFVFVEKNMGLDKRKADYLHQKFQQNLHQENLILLNKSLSFSELMALSHVEHFDVVLASHFFKTLHIPKGYTRSDLLDILTELADVVFIEVNEIDSLKPLLDLEDSAIYKLKKEGAWHQVAPHLYAATDPSVKLRASFTHKRVVKFDDATPFHQASEKPPGISLITFLAFRGLWPTQEVLVDQMRSFEYPISLDRVVIQGQKVIVLPEQIRFKNSFEIDVDRMDELLHCKTQKNIQELLNP